MLIDLGWLFVPFGAFIIVGASNAVNLTDGLDGLAIVPVMIAAASFGFIAYLVGMRLFAEYLQIAFRARHRRADGDLRRAGRRRPRLPLVQCASGRRSSWATRARWRSAAPSAPSPSPPSTSWCSAIVGGLFVLEAVSVIVQVACFRLIGKRVFRMAPLHHHFEQKGWSESTVVIRFWIIAVVLALLGLATLKLR